MPSMVLVLREAGREERRGSALHQPLLRSGPIAKASEARGLVSAQELMLPCNKTPGQVFISALHPSHL